MARLVKNPKAEGEYLAHGSDGNTYPATKVNRYTPQGVMFMAIPTNVQILGYTAVKKEQKNKTSKSSSKLFDKRKKK